MLGLKTPMWQPLPGYDQAACKNMDVSQFFPTTNAGINEARMTCFWCPLGKNGGVPEGKLVDSCLEYALDMEVNNNYRYGIWGGSGPMDRKAMHRGEMTADDLFGPCGWCEEPVVIAGATRAYCSRECQYKGRRYGNKGQEEVA
jgi:hypothetical protein